jgi:hypothetical protein
MDYPDFDDEDILHYRDAVLEAIKLVESTREVLGENSDKSLDFGGITITVAANPGVKEYIVRIVPGP